MSIFCITQRWPEFLHLSVNSFQLTISTFVFIKLLWVLYASSCFISSSRSAVVMVPALRALLNSSSSSCIIRSNEAIFVSLTRRCVVSFQNILPYFAFVKLAVEHSTLSKIHAISQAFLLKPPQHKISFNSCIQKAVSLSRVTHYNNDQHALVWYIMKHTEPKQCSVIWLITTTCKQNRQ